MKPFLLPLVLLSLASPLVAQNPAPAPAPARVKMNAAPTSPELLPDGRVTFRCKAPNANEVKVSGQFGKE